MDVKTQKELILLIAILADKIGVGDQFSYTGTMKHGEITVDNEEVGRLAATIVGMTTRQRAVNARFDKVIDRVNEFNRKQRSRGRGLFIYDRNLAAAMDVEELQFLHYRSRRDNPSEESVNLLKKSITPMIEKLTKS